MSSYPVPSLHFIAAEALSNNVRAILAQPSSLRLLSEESCALLFSLLYRKLRLTFELVQAFKECGHTSILLAINELDVTAAAGFQTVPASIRGARK